METTVSREEAVKLFKALRLKSYEHAEVEQAKTEAIVNGHKPEWHIWYGDT